MQLIFSCSHLYHTDIMLFPDVTLFLTSYTWYLIFDRCLTLTAIIWLCCEFPESWLCCITGVHHVLSTVVGREFSLQETCREFVRRYSQKQVDKQALPMLASACPGLLQLLVLLLTSLLASFMINILLLKVVFGSFFWQRQWNVIWPRFVQKLLWNSIIEEFKEDLV